MLCKIKFNRDGSATHISQVLAGFKLLEDQGIVDTEVTDRHFDFKKLGLYDHSCIVEVQIDDLIIAYDMADGYQSIVDKDLFDSHLDRVSYYFKRSYSPEFQKGMRNENKVKPFGLNYHCTCKGNPYDIYEKQAFSTKELRRRISYFHGEKKWFKLIDYKNFVSNNHYDSYRILFLTRLWDSGMLNKEQLRQSFQSLNDVEFNCLVEKWTESLDNATRTRIELLRSLNAEFGNLFEGGVEDSDFSRKICPDLIVDKQFTSKENFMNLLRSNYICIASTGLHDSIGWKTAEYVTNARAFVTEPLRYTLTGNFSAPNNYLEFNNSDECISVCEKLLKNVDLIHEIENNNASYYKEYLAPDQIIKRTLEVCGIIH